MFTSSSMEETLVSERIRTKFLLNHMWVTKNKYSRELKKCPVISSVLINGPSTNGVRKNYLNILFLSVFLWALIFLFDIYYL